MVAKFSYLQFYVYRSEIFTIVRLIALEFVIMLTAILGSFIQAYSKL